MTQEVIFALENYLNEKKNENVIRLRKEKALQEIKMLQELEPLSDLSQAIKWIDEEKK